MNPDPHHFVNLDPHQIKVRIRIHIKVISWIRNLIVNEFGLQMTQSLETIQVGGCVSPGSSVVDPHPDPHESAHHFVNLDPHPDPHQIKVRIRIHIKVINWIRNLIGERIRTPDDAEPRDHPGRGGSPGSSVLDPDPDPQESASFC